MKQNEFSDTKNISPYRYENFFNIYVDDNNEYYYNILRSINIISSNNSNVEDEYVIKPQDTWYLISYKYYNTGDLWWLVCAYNQISNASIMPSVGTRIKLLKGDYLATVLTELKFQVNN